MFTSWKRHHLFTLGVAVLAVGLASWWGLRGGEEAAPAATTRPPLAEPVRPAPAPVEPSTAARSAREGRAWVPGAQYRYAVDTTQQVSFQPAQPGAAAPPGMRFHIQGEWLVGIASVTDTQVEARVVLNPSVLSVSVDGKDALEPELRRSLEANLSLPCFVTLEPSGAVRLVHVQAGLDVLAQGILRSLVASTQFVLKGAPRDTWQEEEQDSTGQYQAAYRRQQGLHFEKTKRGYTHVATSQGLQPVDASRLRLDVRTLTAFELGEDLWPEHVQGQEQLGVDAGEGMPKVSNALQVSLRLLERGRDATLVGLLARERAGLSTAPLASYVAPAQDPKDAYRRLLAGKRFEDLVQDLRTLPKPEKERDDARTAALERLRALFVLEPSEAAKVPGVLRSGMDPLAASPMLGALSAASTPEAVHALSEIVADGALGVPVRTDAVAALGMAETPTPEGVQSLRDLSGSPQPELRDTATLGLGNSAYQLHDEDARGAQSLVRELGARFRAAKTPEEQALLLRALGNTRDPGMLSLIEEALGSPVSGVRQAALEALRNVPDAGADRILMARMLGDAAPEVRRTAVFAYGFRPLAPALPALERALRTDPANIVRAEVVSLLGANLATLPDARRLLTWTSQNDSDPNLRQTALGFLAAVATTK